MSKASQNTSELTSAIDDIRHKLVEEPWFGQSTTENIDMAMNNLEGQSESFESFYGIAPDNETHSQNVTPEQEQAQQQHPEHEQDL